jgi:hypothetical protein
MVILATWPACPGGGQGLPRLANTWRAWAAGADEGALGVFGFLAGDEHHRVCGRDDGTGAAGGCVQGFGVDELECHRAVRPGQDGRGDVVSIGVAVSCVMKPLADELIGRDPRAPGEGLRCRFYAAVVCRAFTYTAEYGIAAGL